MLEFNMVESALIVYNSAEKTWYTLATAWENVRPLKGVFWSN